jgi:hypothetical protein
MTGLGNKTNCEKRRGGSSKKIEGRRARFLEKEGVSYRECNGEEHRFG